MAKQKQNPGDPKVNMALQQLVMKARDYNIQSFMILANNDTQDEMGFHIEQLKGEQAVSMLLQAMKQVFSMVQANPNNAPELKAYMLTLQEAMLEAVKKANATVGGKK